MHNFQCMRIYYFINIPFFIPIRQEWSKFNNTKNKITLVSLGRERLLEDSWELSSFVESVSIFSSLVPPADSAAFNRKSKGFVYWLVDSKTSKSWDFSSHDFTAFFSSDGFRCLDRTPCSFSLYANSGVVLVELKVNYANHI